MATFLIDLHFDGITESEQLEHGKALIEESLDSSAVSLTVYNWEQIQHLLVTIANDKQCRTVNLETKWAAQNILAELGIPVVNE